MSLPFSRMFDTSMVRSAMLDAEFVAGRRRPVARFQDTEMLGEADLLVLGQLLIAEHDHEVPVPGVENGRDRLRRRLLAQIDADDFGAERRRQRLYDKRACVFRQIFRDNGLVHGCSIPCRRGDSVTPEARLLL